MQTLLQRSLNTLVKVVQFCYKTCACNVQIMVKDSYNLQITTHVHAHATMLRKQKAGRVLE